jgi:hypothetical protein
MPKIIAVVDGHTATVKLEVNDSPVELVFEDEHDLAAIQLTPSIAREIIAKLTGWLESTETAGEEVSPDVLAAAFRDVYAHIYKQQPAEVKP